MKKAIFIFALCFATSLTFAQQIDTLVKSPTSVRINPVKASFQDTVNSVFLGAYVVSDNLKNSATFYWCLMLPVKDSAGVIIGAGAKTAEGNYTMTPEQYTAWCQTPSSCETYPFTVIAQAYGLTFPSVTSKK